MSSRAKVRCAIYVRVSTPDQKLAQQLREVRAAVKARGWTVAHEYKEKRSGKPGAKRPEWDALRKAAARREFGAVAVWAADRMGRSTVEVLHAAEEFESRGVRLLIVKEDIESGTPMGKAFLIIGAMFAELERESIRARTRTGLAGARARGVQLGRRAIEVPTELLDTIIAGDRSAAEVAREIGCSDRTVRMRVQMRKQRGRSQPTTKPRKTRTRASG